MKLFVVLYEEDGNTVKAPGVSETEVKRVALRIAATDIELVWRNIEHIRKDPEKDFIGVYEEQPMIQVLSDASQGDAI